MRTDNVIKIKRTTIFALLLSFTTAGTGVHLSCKDDKTSIRSMKNTNS